MERRGACRAGGFRQHKKKVLTTTALELVPARIPLAGNTNTTGHHSLSRMYALCSFRPDDKAADSAAEWTGWRGAARDGRVAWLPDSLPKSPEFAWSAELSGDGLGGIAAGQGFVVTGSRDALDRHDVFQCFDAKEGTLVWQHLYPVSGKLDYGNSPRATPLIYGDCVYTLGAFGHLCCLELESGIVLWQRNLAADFQSPHMIWGHSGSPLIAGGHLIVQPGGKKASLVAIDPETGEDVWTTEGIDASYSSFVAMKTGTIEQVIGYDAKSLGGWDAKTGKRLWSLIPPELGDFNVPTPVVLGERLLVSSENNGTRIYHFNPDGTLHTQPDAQNDDLKPDSHTPVESQGRIYGIWNDLYELDPADQLKTRNTLKDDAFTGYGCLIASDNRLLALTIEGELLLISTDGDAPKILSRLSLTDDNVQVMSHPALVGKSLFVRVGSTLSCLELGK